MSWESQVFPLQYQDFLHLKFNFPHLKSNFPCTKSDLPKSAFYFLQRLSDFFDGFLNFFNGFPLFPAAFQISPTAFCFPRNPRKSIYCEKYTKDCYSSFGFFTTRSPSFVITNKQYLRDYPTWKTSVYISPMNGNYILCAMSHNKIQQILQIVEYLYACTATSS